MALRELQIVLIGEPTAAFVKELEAPIMQVLGVSAFPGKLGLPNPIYAFNKDRKQFNTSAVMRRLNTVREIGIPWLLGITDVDLFVPDMSFVYGDADREGRVAVMSLNRLKAEGDAWKRRAYVEAVHLAGHLVGLAACEDARCAMFTATTITDAERRQLQLCTNCRNELARLRKTA